MLEEMPVLEAVVRKLQMSRMKRNQKYTTQQYHLAAGLLDWGVQFLTLLLIGWF